MTNACKIKLGLRQPAQAATTPVTAFLCPGSALPGHGGVLAAREVVLSLGQGLIRFSSVMVQQPVLQGPGPA